MFDLIMNLSTTQPQMNSTLYTDDLYLLSVLLSFPEKGYSSAS